MSFFISTESVEQAYNELKSFECVTPSIIHIFLILKGVGYNSTTYEPISWLNERSYLPAFKISSLFSPYEKSPEKYDFISPFELVSPEIGQTYS